MDRIKALDGWRAISAGLVIASHLQGFSAIRFPFPLSGYGTLGVEYFFGISGFVIARGLLSPTGGGFRQFYIRRAFRILPPLLMFLFLVIFLVLSGALPVSAVLAGKALVFACNYSDCGGWFGGHLWSLSVEEQFYFVCPILILATRSRWVITGAMAAVPAVALGLRFGHLSDAGGFVTNFTVIAAGVACAANERAILRLVRKVPLWVVPLTFASTVAIMAVNLKMLTSLLQILALGPLVMFTLLRTSIGAGHITAWLSGAVITTLGGATYSIYLFQQIATAPYAGAGILFYAATVTACLVWGLLSFRFIERPLIDLGRSLAAKLGRRPDVALGVDEAFTPLRPDAEPSL